MTYERFEDLPVWKAALDLAKQVYSMTAHSAFKGQYSSRDQLERAAVSISSNIAEGFERGTTQELLTFLYIARGSSGEVRSLVCLLETLAGFSDLKSQISNLKSAAESISRQLRGWANSLQESGIKGQRYLTEKARRSTQTSKDRNEFLEELNRIREEGRKRPAGKDITDERG